MRYSYEYKLKCIEMYRQGIWEQAPKGVSDKVFHDTIREWVRIENELGSDALKHHSHNRNWTPEEKLELISQVIAGKSNKAVAVTAGISDGMLYTWVKKYKLEGYEGLASMKKGRPSKENTMKPNKTPQKLNETEREELIRLRAENEYIKAENEVIKKEIALREEKEAARLKARKQQSSKNSEKKDSN